MPNMETISYDEFKKLDARIGTIRFVEPVEGSEKLLRCLVEFTPELKTEDYTDTAGVVYPVRQIVSGIRPYFPEFETLVGRQVLYVVNLEPRSIMGITSHGMILAVGDDAPTLLVPETPVASGSKIR
jgi:methionyl-tRNA synthetase